MPDTLSAPRQTADLGLPTLPEFDQREELRLLSMALNASGNAVVVTDADSRLIYTNQSFTRMLGYRLDEVRGQVPSHFLAGPHTDQATIAHVGTSLTARKETQVEVLLYNKQGKPLWIAAAVNPVFDEHGELKHVVAIYTDITHTKMHELLQHKVLNALARELPLLEVMELVCREIEYIAPDVVVSILRVDVDDRLQPLAAPSLPAHVIEAMRGLRIGPDSGTCGSAAYWGEQVLTADIASDPRWSAAAVELALPLGLAACWSTPIKASDGRVLGTLAFYARETGEPGEFLQRLALASEQLCALALEREEARAHIRQLAFYDVLTGLPNRRRLYSKAERALASARHGEEELAVLFVDLDRFKQVNDSMGHAVGDELLCEVAQRIEGQVRVGDIVGRLSGDEFVVVAPACEAAGAVAIAERILAALTKPIRIGEFKLRPSASIGISLFPEGGEDFDTLLQRADIAMYQSKTAGRNQYCFFSGEMNRQVQERQLLESALREALEHDQQQLQLHYQPQIRLADDKLYGVEALARWHHPELGEVSPARFVPMAEECGLIGALGDWALGEACRQLADWRRRGLAIPAVSVNLSPRNFHHAGLPRLVADTLAQHGLTANDLTLEMTESVLMDSSPNTLATFHALHQQGIRLAIDDFGTGYSSLGYLQRLPVDELKLDQRFVRDLSSDEDARALAHAILHIGASLRLTVVAEGVEQPAQRQFLADEGCQVAQGYLFGKPLPAAELETWFSTHNASLIR